MSAGRTLFHHLAAFFGQQKRVLDPEDLVNYVAGLEDEPRAQDLFAPGDSQRDAQEAYSFIVDRLVKEDEKLLDMLQVPLVSVFRGKHIFCMQPIVHFPFMCASLSPLRCPYTTCFAPGMEADRAFLRQV